MTKRVYVVLIPLPGNPTPMELCRCEDAEKVAALVRAYLEATVNRPCDVTIQTQLVEV